MTTNELATLVTDLYDTYCSPDPEAIPDFVASLDADEISALINQWHEHCADLAAMGIAPDEADIAMHDALM